MMLYYEIILYCSKDDRAFIAEVPELPGCAADGKTYQEAVQNKKPGFYDNVGIFTDILKRNPVSVPPDRNC